MLKLKPWRLLMPDDNTGGDSSTTSDDKEQESSTAETAEETTEETDATTEKKTPEDGDATTEETPVDEAEAETEDAAEKEEKEVAAEPTVDKPGDEKIPFNAHPRFKELVTEKNQYRDEAAALKPVAERMQVLDNFVAQNNIAPQELQNALEYLRLRRQDPAAAFKVLKQDYDALAPFAGEALHPDLQAEVAAGTLSTERAKEIAVSRAKAQHAQWQQQTSAQTQEQQAAQAIQGGVNVWAQSQQKTDPDFRPKAAGAVDGKWEYVDMKLRSLRQANPPRTPQDAVKLAEQAYAEANKFFGAFRAKAKTVKPAIRSTSNTANSNAVVKTPEDVVRAIISGKRPHQLKYS